MPIVHYFHIKACSANTYYKKFRNRICISKEGKAMKEFIHKKIEGCPQTKGQVEVQLIFNFRTKRKRDLDNLFKPLIDCIKDKLIEDDDQIYRIVARKSIGEKADGIALVILPFEEIKEPSSVPGEA